MNKITKMETTEVAGRFENFAQASAWLAGRGWTANGLGDFTNPAFAGWVRHLKDRGLMGWWVVQSVPVED